MPSNDSTLTCKTKDSTVAVCVAQTGVGVLYFYVSSLLCICTLLIPRKCDVCIVINSRRTIQLKVACSYCLIMLAAFIAKSAMASVRRSRQHTYRDSPGAECDSASIHFSLTIRRTGNFLLVCWVRGLIVDASIFEMLTVGCAVGRGYERDWLQLHLAAVHSIRSLKSDSLLGQINWFCTVITRNEFSQITAIM